MAKEELIIKKQKPIHYKGNGVLLSYNKTNKGSRILGIGIFTRFKYRVQIALADELWYDGETGKKYIIKYKDNELFLGLLAVKFK